MIVPIILCVLALIVFVGLMWWGRAILREHPIRAFAVLIVAGVSFYIGWIEYRLTEVLSSEDWCSKALQAERVSREAGSGMTSCTSLLTLQLEALATNSHIGLGAMAGSLLVLIVIVIAGGVLTFQFDKTGAAASIGGKGDEAAKAAQRVADAATEEKDAIVQSGVGTNGEDG